MSKVSPVDAYLNDLAPERRAALGQLRELIRETVPEAIETMKYRMPTYEYKDGILCAFASQKRYMSLYMEPVTVDRHRDDLEDLDLGKSCIRFKQLEKLPLDTVRLMLQETVHSRGTV